MKISVNYKKGCNGNITANISIKESGDYPTDYIFSGKFYENFDDMEVFVGVSKGNSNNISIIYPSDKILSEVEKLIKEIEKSLDKWRSIPVPPEQEYNI